MALTLRTSGGCRVGRGLLQDPQMVRPHRHHGPRRGRRVPNVRARPDLLLAWPRAPSSDGPVSMGRIQVPGPRRLGMGWGCWRLSLPPSLWHYPPMGPRKDAPHRADQKGPGRGRGSSGPTKMALWWWDSGWGLGGPQRSHLASGLWQRSVQTLCPRGMARPLCVAPRGAGAT